MLFISLCETGIQAKRNEGLNYFVNLVGLPRVFKETARRAISECKTETIAEHIMESLLDENFAWFSKNVLGTKFKHYYEFIRLINGTGF